MAAVRAKGNLRPVDAGEMPARRRTTQQTILAATDNGTTRESLVAMRRRIAKALDDPDCPPRDLAALSRRELEIIREIEAIDASSREGGIVDSSPDEPMGDAAAR